MSTLFLGTNLIIMPIGVTLVHLDGEAPQRSLLELTPSHRRVALLPGAAAQRASRPADEAACQRVETEREEQGNPTLALQDVPALAGVQAAPPSFLPLHMTTPTRSRLRPRPPRPLRLVQGRAATQGYACDLGGTARRR